MAPQITVSPEQSQPLWGAGQDRAAPLQVPPPRLPRSPRGEGTGAHRGVLGPAEGVKWPMAPRSWGRGVGSRLDLVCLSFTPVSSSRRASGQRPCSGSPNGPDAWQARDAPGPGWLPYVFNKIRQIGPGDRDCSKAVVKQRNLGQCKRQKGPSWKDRWVPAPCRGGPARCEREPAEVPPQIFITLVPPLEKGLPSRRGGRPPGPRSPALPAPPPRGCPPGAPRSWRGRAHCPAPLRTAPYHCRPEGPVTRPACLSCPPYRRGPAGPVRPFVAPGCPAGSRRAVLVKEQGGSRLAGAASPWPPCSHPRRCQAVQRRVGSCRRRPPLIHRGTVPRARAGPHRLSQPVRKSPRHVLRTKPRRRSSPPRARRRAGGAGAAGVHGETLPLRDPALVSPGEAKTQRRVGQ
ncbi:translation initiation factor IF-2-like [Indicator indicator]|uniref:translation initiation factor IF-2-like n=1 Tax=Indicator indicator TaxID=1002788 RepID=UPI0023DFEBC5|nr:translation initiation factor IF-2-like [Indicator indicator]